MVSLGPAAAETVPFAMGIALSPFPVVPAIVLLFSDRARAAGLAFAGCFFVGVAAIVAVFLLLSGLIEGTDYPPVWASWARIILGVVLLVVALRQWLGRSQDSEPPAWMSSIESASPSGAARLGLLLSAANPKVIILAAGGGLALGEAEAPAAGTLALVLAFAAISSVAVLTPVGLLLVAGDRVLSPLGSLRDWLQRHNSAITTVVVAVIGLLVLREGLAGL